MLCSGHVRRWEGERVASAKPAQHTESPQVSNPKTMKELERDMLATQESLRRAKLAVTALESLNEAAKHLHKVVYDIDALHPIPLKEFRDKLIDPLACIQRATALLSGV